MTSRGNAREGIFDDDADRKAFVEVLGRESHLLTVCRYVGSLNPVGVVGGRGLRSEA